MNFAEILTESETKMLLGALRERAEQALRRGFYGPAANAFLVEFALGTGLRASELANLYVSDLLLRGSGDGFVIVRRGKGSSPGAVRLSGALAKRAAEYLERVRPHLLNGAAHEFLFVGRRGQPLNRHTIWHRLRTALRQAGIENPVVRTQRDGKPRYRLHPHSLRHTAITRVARAGGIEVAREFARHASIGTTSRYRHVLDEEYRRAVERAFGGSGEVDLDSLSSEEKLALALRLLAQLGRGPGR